MTILVVDDDQDDLDLFCEVAQEIDSSIMCFPVHTGLEAIEFLNSDLDLPDMIFLDINMPVMDGLTCLKEIRKDNRFNDITIYMYSTSTSPHEIYEAGLLGAKFIGKAVSYSNLLSSLRKLLRV